MNVEDFRLLYDYNAWADHRTLDACAALSSEQFTRDLGSSFGSVRDTLLHIMQVEWLWLERWHGRSPTSFAANGEYSNVESIRARWLEIERDLLDYIASLTTEEVQRVVRHKTTAGVPQAAPLWQMLQHLVNHGTYHRGQVATMLRQLGAKPIGTDLIYFYRERAAQAKA
ncbi:MAG: DinB family protein [Candidatus Acidiferrales bacterium]